jgi:TIR domain
MIDRKDFERGPEAYLGWWLYGAPGPAMQATSYFCYATEDKGEQQFQTTVAASALMAARPEKYQAAADVALPYARGLIFLGTWNDGREYGLSLPLQTKKLPTPQIRDAIVRGLHRLYEDGFTANDVIVDYQGVALALGVATVLVERAAEHLLDTNLVTDEPATLGRNWSTGHIWLSASGVSYAENLPPIATTQGTGSAAGVPDDSTVLWDVFISHAGEDKDEVARPIAELLRARDAAVWLDESELSLGDSLRAKIDYGLANSRYGVVILSESFFQKDWPQRELDGLSALESRRRKVVLPVWHRVDRDYIAKFSPMLADKYAVRTSGGLDRVATEILRAIGKG